VTAPSRLKPLLRGIIAILSFAGVPGLAVFADAKYWGRRRNAKIDF
jgi:hypothetical protein